MLATLLERVTAAVTAGQSAEAFLAGRPVDDFDPRWGSPRAAARLAAIAFLGMTAEEPAAKGAGPKGTDEAHADDEHADDGNDGDDGR